MKKQFFLFMSLLLPVVANADSSGTCGENLTWTFESSTGTLTISGTGRMWEYRYWEDVTWHNLRNDISHAIIENGITSIGNHAFEGCSGLTTVTIPDGVTSIGNRAFSGCSSLTSITIPHGVTSIGNYAFEGCRSLTSITIPDGVTSIDYYAFQSCI